MELDRLVIPVSDYDLDATLDSGQAFRWRRIGPAWEGVIHGRWVRLFAVGSQIIAEFLDETQCIGLSGEGANKDLPSAIPVLRSLGEGGCIPHAALLHYLQTDINLPTILATFPTDEPMQAAVRACPGLRLLRQDPWECLASFVCSSNKRIVQIKQIIRLLCERFGEPIPIPAACEPCFAFPTYQRLAEATDAELRACKMGFRAPHLLAIARRLAAGEFDLQRVAERPLVEARELLMELPGVGPKIADCVLLFAYGFPTAFPMDTWILKTLHRLYFPRRKPSLKRLRRFSETHFGPHSGYAQQYLFHSARNESRSRREETHRQALSP